MPIKLLTSDFLPESFMDLLVKSKLKFHKLFQKTYGIIYERNSDVFIDFFKDLESYYDDGKVNLEDALREFFSRLYQRMFTVFNAQHNFDSTSVNQNTSPKLFQQIRISVPSFLDSIQKNVVAENLRNAVFHQFLFLRLKFWLPRPNRFLI